MRSPFKNAKAVLIASYLVLLVLILNSAYLSYKYWQFYFGGGMLAAFNCTDGCDSVMLSKYALIFGIPVPFYGLAMFLTITVIYIFLNTRSSTYEFKGLVTVLDGLLLSSCFAAMCFIYLMYSVLHMVCKFCLLSHICTLLFSLIYFFYIKTQYWKK